MRTGKWHSLPATKLATSGAFYCMMTYSGFNLSTRLSFIGNGKFNKVKKQIGQE